MEQKLIVGDRVVFNDTTANREAVADNRLVDVTLGRIYTIGRLHPYSENPQFIDDVGDWDSAAADSGSGEFTKIVA